MSYESLEQRTAQGYLDLFPQFIPDEQAPVSVSEQREFYDFMKRFYQLTYNEPQLFIPRLHEDDCPPVLYSEVSDSKRNVQTNMKKFKKAVDAVVQIMFLLGIGKEVTLNSRQKAIFSKIGIHDFVNLPPAWVWMAKKENLARFETPARFAHCHFREDYTYTVDIYTKAFENKAFHKLIDWMTVKGYQPFDSYDTTASNCKFSLTYANPAWSEDRPKGGFEYKIKHTGISLRHEPFCSNPWIFGVCIPGGMKLYLEHFNEMPAQVQNFVISRVKRCDGCRYCVQTDKTGKRPFAKIAVQHLGQESALCPYYPGYNFWWTSIDSSLADNIIALLNFMDQFVSMEKIKAH